MTVTSIAIVKSIAVTVNNIGDERAIALVDSLVGNNPLYLNYGCQYVVIVQSWWCCPQRLGESYYSIIADIVGTYNVIIIMYSIY
jgi:hypothetical protein